MTADIAKTVKARIEAGEETARIQPFLDEWGVEGLIYAVTTSICEEDPGIGPVSVLYTSLQSIARYLVWEDLDNVDKRGTKLKSLIDMDDVWEKWAKGGCHGERPSRVQDQMWDLIPEEVEGSGYEYDYLFDLVIHLLKSGASPGTGEESGKVLASIVDNVRSISF